MKKEIMDFSYKNNNVAFGDGFSFELPDCFMIKPGERS